MHTDHRLSADLGSLAAFSVPLAIGMLAASPEPYWLDSPEFTAAVQTLGIPHPPGHPLYVMLAKPFTLLPFGSIAFRVAVASAVFGALASLLLYKFIKNIVAVCAPSLSSLSLTLTSLTAALVAAVAPGWWFQCVRAEVYSLQILLVMGFIYPLSLTCVGSFKRKYFYLVAFIAGLGLANHHYIGIVALPAVLPVLIAEAGRIGGWGATLLSGRLIIVALAGLMPYVFLPIRSLSGAAVSLGGVHSWSDFFWVVSAKVYQKSMVRQHIAPLEDRTLDAVFTMMGELHPIIVIIAIGGLYFLLRQPRTRLIGLVLVLLAGITLLLRAVMGFDPFNPDYYGYMLPVLASFAVGFAVFAAVILGTLQQAIQRRTWIVGLLAMLLLAVPIIRARHVHARVDLSRFRATRLFVDLALNNVPSGTLVLTTYYKLFFALSSARYTEGTRPDVTVINPHFFAYPGYLNAMLTVRPDLKDLARTMVVSGQLTETAVADLAWKGPLRVEPDIWLSDPVARYLLPDGPVFMALAEPLSRADVENAATAHFEGWARLYTLLGTAWKESETKRMLSWCHYQDALYFARRGAIADARRSGKMFQALGNAAPQIDRLLKVLETQKGPLDIRPFLPDAVEQPDEDRVF
ncbi:MAG: DUF2723 domain-containing protein [Myxococcota bacterium]|nr:DUF2723 domain-containing protein [Myxococcota bacterium]